MSTSQTEAARKLRRRAEDKLALSKATNAESLTLVDTQRLLQELQIHQIELEMQNEVLSQALSERDALLEKYSDLYELAPAGYFELDRAGSR
jgi:hypothetical protein